VEVENRERLFKNTSSIFENLFSVLELRGKDVQVENRGQPFF